MMNIKDMNFAVDGDSITQGDQWSYYVNSNLDFKSHYNVAVSSAVWYKRKIKIKDEIIETQDYVSPDFKGISYGWEDTSDKNELQLRINNCAVVHTQRFIDDVSKEITPVPDVFGYAMGTNDLEEYFGNADKELAQSFGMTDLFTEAGAMCWCVDNLRKNYPDVIIFMMTPIKAADKLHNQKTEKTIKIMKEICKTRQIHLIDCYNECDIKAENEKAGEEGKYLRDGLHPKTEGQKLMGDFVSDKLREILSKR